MFETYTHKKIFIAYMKITFNWASYIFTCEIWQPYKQNKNGTPKITEEYYRSSLYVKEFLED